MCITLIVVMVSWVYASPQTHEIVYLKYLYPAVCWQTSSQELFVHSFTHFNIRMFSILRSPLLIGDISDLPLI